MEARTGYVGAKAARDLVAELRTLLDQATQQPLLQEARQLCRELATAAADLGIYRAAAEQQRRAIADLRSDLKVEEFQAIQGGIAAGLLNGKNAEERVRQEHLYLNNNETVHAMRREIARLESVLSQAELDYSAALDRLTVLRKKADLTSAALNYLGR